MFEIGLSIPAETSLRVPNIREASAIWSEMFDSASVSIDIENYYVADRRPSGLTDIIDRLKRAAHRGVAVRFLLDKLLYGQSNIYANEYFAAINYLIKFRNIQIEFSRVTSLTGGLQHAKFFIVDNQSSWLGSQNFDWRAIEHIFEVGIKIDNARLTGQLRGVFKMDWSTDKIDDSREKAAGYGWVSGIYKAEIHHAKIVASPPSLLPSPHMNELSHIIEIISGASCNLSLQLRQYRRQSRDGSIIDADPLHDALRIAAARGVKLRLLFDQRVRRHVDQLDALRELTTFANVKIRVLSIPESSLGPIPYARMTHAKLMVVDGHLSWLGTGNMAPEDFMKSRNVGVIVEGTKFARDLENVFETCWTSKMSCVL